VPNLKAIRRRIGSVRSTQKITAAMEMVSAAKLRRAEHDLKAFRPYAERLSQVVGRLVARAGDGHPLLRAQPEGPTTVLLLGSDRGLCGGYNASLAGFFLNCLGDTLPPAGELRVLLQGRKNVELLKHLGCGSKETVVLSDPPKADDVQALAQRLQRDYLEGRTSAVWLVFSRFVSTAQQEPCVQPLLPLPAGNGFDPATGEDPALAGDTTIYEPGREVLLEELLPLQLNARLLWAALEARASEHGARMASMQGATRSAGDMIDRLTLEYNRARQSTITGELMEIVAGAEALR